MALSDLVTSLRDSLTVGRVFGEPYERGGAGGGAGKKQQTSEEGEGGGLGIIARPAGAYVIKGGEVTWHPAVDVNRIVTLGIAGWVAVAWVLARSLRRRA